MSNQTTGDPPILPLVGQTTTDDNDVASGIRVYGQPPGHDDIYSSGGYDTTEDRLRRLEAEVRSVSNVVEGMCQILERVADRLDVLSFSALANDYQRLTAAFILGRSEHGVIGRHRVPQEIAWQGGKSLTMASLEQHFGRHRVFSIRPDRFDRSSNAILSQMLQNYDKTP